MKRFIMATVSLAVGLLTAGEVETAKWQAAIDAAAAKGGGRVIVPIGWHETGMLTLKSNVELHLCAGAVLAGTGDAKAYGGPKMPRAFICAVGATNVAVTGAGELFGNAWAWALDRNPGITGMAFHGCRNVRLEGFTLRDASAWAIHLYHNDGVTVRNVRVDTQACECDDGIDIESKNVLIEFCDVDAGDDAYCLKASDPKFAVENVVVRDSVARSHCNAFKFGTGSAGIMRNVRFERCRAFASRRMFRDVAPMPTDPEGLLNWKPVHGAPWYHCGPGFGAINVECVDGGIVENVLFDGITVEGFQTPIFVRGGKRRGDHNTNGNNDFNILRNVTIRNVRGRADGRTPSTITGVDACRPANIVLENVALEVPGEGRNDRPFSWPGEELAGKYPQTNMFDAYHLPAYGLFVDKADVTLKNVNFTLRKGTSDRRPGVYRVGTDVPTDASSAALAAVFCTQGFNPSSADASVFVVTSDVHTDQPLGKGRFNHDHLAEHVAAWNALSPRPVFAGVLGDIANLNEFFGHRPGAGAAAQMADEGYGAFKDIISKLDPRIRRVYALGNHDTYPGEDDRALWRRHFPDQPPYCAFDACGIRFLKWDGGGDAVFSAGQEAWIRAECAKVPKDVPLVILVHQPAVGLCGRERDVGRLCKEVLAGRTAPTWLLAGHEHGNRLERWTLPGGGMLAVATHAKDVKGWWAYGVKAGRIVARVFWNEEKKAYEPGPMPETLESQGAIPTAYSDRADVVWSAFVGSAAERAARVKVENTGDNGGWLYYVGSLMYRFQKGKVAPKATRLGILGEFPGRRFSWTPSKCYVSADGCNWKTVTRGKPKNGVAEYVLPTELVSSDELWVEYDGYGMDCDDCIAGFAFLR